MGLYSIKVHAEIFAEDIDSAEKAVRSMFLKAPESNRILLMEISEIKEEDGEERMKKGRKRWNG